MSWSELNLAGAVNPTDRVAFNKGKVKRDVSDAFPQMFSKETLFLDTLEELPSDVRGALNGSGHYQTAVTKSSNGKAGFDYHKFHLGCELTYSKVQKVKWDPAKEKDHGLAIRGFVEEFGHFSEPILHLKGTPHNIGLTPTYVFILLSRPFSGPNYYTARRLT